MRVRTNWFVAVVSLVVAAASPAVAATRYVDKGNPSCLDTGPGTQATPYCNISPAAKVAQPGDTVIHYMYFTLELQYNAVVAGGVQ